MRAESANDRRLRNLRLSVDSAPPFARATQLMPDAAEDAGEKANGLYRTRHTPPECQQPTLAAASVAACSAASSPQSTQRERGASVTCVGEGTSTLHTCRPVAASNMFTCDRRGFDDDHSTPSALPAQKRSMGAEEGMASQPSSLVSMVTRGVHAPSPFVSSPTQNSNTSPSVERYTSAAASVRAHTALMPSGPAVRGAQSHGTAASSRFANSRANGPSIRALEALARGKRPSSKAPNAVTLSRSESHVTMTSPWRASHVAASGARTASHTTATAVPSAKREARGHPKRTSTTSAACDRRPSAATRNSQERTRHASGSLGSVPSARSHHTIRDDRAMNAAVSTSAPAVTRQDECSGCVHDAEDTSYTHSPTVPSRRTSSA
eukprot:Opistho-1_new@20813